MCAVVEHVHDQIITAGSELQRLLWLRQDGSNWMQLGWRRLGNGSPQILVQWQVNGASNSYVGATLAVGTTPRFEIVQEGGVWHYRVDGTDVAGLPAAATTLNLTNLRPLALGRARNTCDQAGTTFQELESGRERGPLGATWCRRPTTIPVSTSAWCLPTSSRSTPMPSPVRSGCACPCRKGQAHNRTGVWPADKAIPETWMIRRPEKGQESDFDARRIS